MANSMTAGDRRAQPVALRKTSLVDYPGKVAAALFFPFCNLRCPWCQNGSLITGHGESLVSLDAALAVIGKRRKVLGGVVLSGGEPCLFSGLGALIRYLKEEGFSVKLDTNGLFPAILEALFTHNETRPDFVAMDLKFAPERYGELGGPPDSAALLAVSASLIRQSGVDYEFRSLALPEGFFTDADVAALAPLAGNAEHWRFRPFVPGTCLAPDWNDKQPGRVDRLSALAFSRVGVPPVLVPAGMSKTDGC
jgi:pyruvate formate lyase activating enzyme